MVNPQSQNFNGGHNYYPFPNNIELAYNNLVRVLADMEASLESNVPDARPLVLADNANNMALPAVSSTNSTSSLELEPAQVNNNIYQSDYAERSVTSSADTINCAENAAPEVLAKPGEVTDYFHCISAHLVRNQINEIDFTVLKANIDRLLEQVQQWPEKENQNTRKTTHIEIMY